MDDIFSGNITRKNFIKFVWPSVMMMVFIAVYYGMDSILVANMVGEEALAALAVAYPVQGLMWGLCIMLASGSSAIVAIRMGEGKQQEANEKYSSVCVLSVIMGCVMTAVVLVFMEPIVDFLGATEALRGYCIEFLDIFAWGFPAAFIGVVYEYFIRVDGSPGFTLFLYIVGGIVHLGLAALLMGPFDMGIAGTGYANVAGLLATAAVGAAYFRFTDTRLRFCRFRPDWKFIGHCYVNGSSELVSESSAGITTFFFNMLVIRMIGDIGPAAVSIVLNLHYVVISVYLGYIMGIAPLISYFYGAKKYDKVNQIIGYSRKFIIVSSIACALGCLIFGEYIVMFFERPGSELYDVALTGTRYLSLALLLGGVNIFASGFFTAYGNGLISAFISASRALIMVIIGMFMLSWLFGMDGIWMSLVFAEVMTLGLTFGMLRKYRDVYHYKLI